MKKISFSFLLAVLLIFSIGPWNTAYANSAPAMKIVPAGQPRIDNELNSRLGLLKQGEMMTVIVTLRQQADLSRVAGATPAARKKAVLQALQTTAKTTKDRLNSLLNARKAQGKLQNFEDFWVFNGFSVTATADLINELAQQPEVLSITTDDLQIVPALGPAEPNIVTSNAPALWNQGYFGQGIVIANMDSGVDVNHPDLSSRWRGGLNSWYDPYGQHPTTPTDLTGHGTQTMGLIVGGDAGGTTIGVAPGAQWIAVKIFNDTGGSTATAIHQGFQWLLDPDGNPATDDAPHVVNNSWSFANPGCYLDFEPDLQSLRAAGILPLFAAGNGGPSANTSFSPANNPSALAVGALNYKNQAYGYSSRGPTTCGGSTGPFPELVAPGVLLKTSDLFGFYTNAYSGTSYAVPQVAGGLALLLSAHPNLSVADQQNALLSSALDLGAAGPDNIYGYGRLDILAALNWLSVGSTATPLPTSTVTTTATFTSTPLATSTFTATLPPTFTSTALPTATFTSTALPTATFTSTSLPTPTFTSTSAAATVMHVGDLHPASAPSGTNWNATVTILIHDNLEQPVAGAVITGSWSNGTKGTVNCITNASGVCNAIKTGLSGSINSVRLTITNVTRSSSVYSSTANHDPDGDSDGTTIVVLRP